MLRKESNWREKAALDAFNGQDVLHYADLPGNVGRRTMDRLVAKGLIEPANSEIGRYSVDFAWTRVRD
jgi:hypothetical protein